MSCPRKNKYTMKIIHTSDWHLGQKLLHRDREKEHQKALDWLLQTIVDEVVDGLIVAGDIFDIGNPPNYARRMYYRFLTGLLNTQCRHILITGGNHDSPAMLDAPSELLATMNIQVIGAATGRLEDEIIEWHNSSGELEAVIAAVPFLRDRDLQYSQAGEGGSARMERVRAGIRQHYADIADLIAERYPKAAVPKMATGHLFATGAKASAKQDNIYIGDTENIAASQFPEVFNYVALGHIHRPQALDEAGRVCYSGSLLPLSFSETKDDKSVYLLQFSGPDLVVRKPLPVPAFRRLKTITGNPQQVEDKLMTFAKKDRDGLTPWVEVLVDTDRMLPQFDQQLRALVADYDVDLLKIKINHQQQGIQQQTTAPHLDHLSPLDVFQMKCRSYGTAPEDMQQLEETFQELQNWMQQREED